MTVDDRLSFDTPRANLLALPVSLLAGVLVGVVGVAEPLALPIRIWFHEIGHALPAWLSGRSALPLPIGFTFWREEPSWFTAGCVLFLIGVIGVVGWREEKRFAVVVAAVLLALQVLLTLVLPAHVTIGWILFGGLAGELVLSTLAMIWFYYPAPDRLRWDFWRYVVIVPAGVVFVSALWLWLRVDTRPSLLPTGSILGTPGDGTGDIDRLLSDYDWTVRGLTYAYRTIGLACLGVLGAHYAVFGLRALRHLRDQRS